MDGKLHSAMGVLPQPFHTQIRLGKLWVANTSLAFTSAAHFAPVAQYFRYGLSQTTIHSSRCASEVSSMNGRQHSTTGVFHKPHKLWVASTSLASTSAADIATLAQQN